MAEIAEVTLTLSTEIGSDNRSIIFTAELSDDLGHPAIYIDGYVGVRAKNFGEDLASAVMCISAGKTVSTITYNSIYDLTEIIGSPIITRVNPTEWTDSNGLKYKIVY